MSVYNKSFDAGMKGRRLNLTRKHIVIFVICNKTVLIQ